MTPAQPIQTQATPAQTAKPTQQNSPAPDDSNLSEDGSEGSVKLHRAFSALNSALTKLADESGVERSATIPYIHEQPMSDHIAAVGQALSTCCGITANILTTSHRADGRGFGSGDGESVAHPADALRSTIIPKGDKNAVAAISACKKLIGQIASLVGDDDPAVKVAKSQLDLVGKHDGENMTVLDMMIALQNIVHVPLQSVARAHSGTKESGHSPRLRAPKVSESKS
jgi:hypothetical protein